MLHLSPHDEAKPQDVEDLMEAIAHLVRALPADRARHGQPYVAFELDHGPGPSGELGMVARRPLPPAAGRRARRRAQRRLPRRPPRPPRRRTPAAGPGRAGIPGHVMRFRKQRGFVYPLLPAADELASPPLEAIAHAQASLGVPSTIRFTLTPAAGQPGGDRAPAASAATRTGSSARSAGACPRAA